MTKFLTDKQKEECTKIMKKLSEKAISALFLLPVDTKLEKYKNYLEVIKRPMDITTVNKKLTENEYHTIAEWKADVEQIWANSLLFHSKDELIQDVTIEMQETFRNLAKFISDDSRQDWINKLSFLREQVGTAVHAYDIVARGGKLGIISASAQKAARAKKKVVNKKPLKRTGIYKLAKEINALKDEKTIVAVLEVIEEEEPTVKVEGDFLELNLVDLKPTTLVAIRNKLDIINSSV